MYLKDLQKKRNGKVKVFHHTVHLFTRLLL